VPETDWRVKSYEYKKLLFAFKSKSLEPEKIYWRRYAKYFNELKQAEQERLKQDELNLLYVALTRARQGLYIIGYGYNSKILGFWFDTITKKLGSDEYSDGEILTKPHLHISEREQNYGAIKGERLVVKEERSLYIPTERGLEIIDTSRRRSMEFGSIIHYALSLIFWLDGVELKTCIQFITDKLRNKFMGDLVGYDHAGPISSMLEDVLTDPDLRFLFFKDNRQAVCKNELAIYFESGKQDISGQIDRLIVEPERIFLVDYKTGDNKPMYKKQLHTYKKGIVQIYEEKEIELMLIFLDKQRGNRIVKID
jgi:ATP-dependent exoDNAse (exonuclease V) beta subunit